MIKYFIVHNQTKQVLAVLDQQPEHIPENYSLVQYSGYVPIRYLEYKNGTVTPTTGAPPENGYLEQEKAKAIKALAGTASMLFQQARTECSLDIPGYDHVFEEKVAEAYDYIVDDNEEVNELNYPLLLSEAKATGITVYDVAKMILAHKSNWISKVSKIDELLLRGQYGIANATDSAKIQSIKNQILTELLSVIPQRP